MFFIFMFIISNMFFTSFIPFILSFLFFCTLYFLLCFKLLPAETYLKNLPSKKVKILQSNQILSLQKLGATTNKPCSYHIFRNFLLHNIHICSPLLQHNTFYHLNNPNSNPYLYFRRYLDSLRQFWEFHLNLHI